MDNVAGPERRLSPRTDRRDVQEVSAIRVRRPSLSVQSPTVRPSVSTPGVHAASTGISELLPPEGNKTPCVSGRLAHPRALARGRAPAHRVPTSTLPRFRPNCESAQVQFVPKPGFHLFGDPIRLDLLPLSSLGRQVAATPGASSEVPGEQTYVGKTMAIVDRLTDLHGHASASRPPAQETNTVRSRGQMVSDSKSNGPSSSVTSRQRSTRMVDQQGKRDARSVSHPFSGPGDDVLRRLKYRMGSPYGRQSGVRPMVGHTESIPYKLAGTASNIPIAQAAPLRGGKPTCANHVRQPDGDRLPEQTGRNAVQTVDVIGGRTMDVVCTAQRHYVRPAHTGRPERPRRSTVSQGSGNRHGMVTSPKSSSGLMGEMGDTPCGSICDLGEHEATQLLLQGSRSGSHGSRCSCPVLGRSLGLRLSTHSPSPEGTEKDQDAHVRTHCHSAVVAEQGVVRGSLGAKQRTASSSTSLAQTTLPTAVEQVPREPASAQPPRLAVVARYVSSHGFSQPVAERIARGKLRKSSLKVYDSRWNIFTVWCTEKRLDPWTCRSTEIADFLFHLWRDVGLASRTVEGYRSAIASTLLKVQNVDIGNDSNLSALIHSFYSDRPITRQILPRWDLSLVLTMLKAPPFECPLHPETVDLKLWTWKTCFLLTLVSGARRSEIHALDPDRIQYSRDQSRVTLRPNLGFMAKNHVARDPATAFKGFTIKALDQSLPVSTRVLCPVRALRWYIRRTKDMRKAGSRLFLPTNTSSSSGVCINTISSWMKQTILMAYKLAQTSSGTSQSIRPRGHEIRAFSANRWQALRNVSITDILRSCRWKSVGTFTEFYLRDMTVFEDGMYAFAEVSKALA